MHSTDSIFTAAPLNKKSNHNVVAIIETDENFVNSSETLELINISNSEMQSTHGIFTAVPLNQPNGNTNSTEEFTILSCNSYNDEIVLNNDILFSLNSSSATTALVSTTDEEFNNSNIEFDGILLYNNTEDAVGNPPATILQTNELDTDYPLITVVAMEEPTEDIVDAEGTTTVESQGGDRICVELPEEVLDIESPTKKKKLLSFPNISFHHSRSDTCGTCDLLHNKTKSEPNNKEAKVKLDVHHRKAEKAREVMKMDHEKSQHPTSETSTIAIDLEQVLSLPALTHDGSLTQEDPEDEPVTEILPEIVEIEEPQPQAVAGQITEEIHKKTGTKRKPSKSMQYEQLPISFDNQQPPTDNFQSPQLICEDLEQACSSKNNDYLSVVAGPSTSDNHDHPLDYSSDDSLKDPNFTVDEKDISDSSDSDIPLAVMRNYIPKIQKTKTSDEYTEKGEDRKRKRFEKSLAERKKIKLQERIMKYTIIPSLSFAYMMSDTERSVWSRDLLSFKNFHFGIAEAFFKKQSWTNRQRDRGYRFFAEGYIQEVFTNKSECIIKAKCFRSQKKNEIPHRLHSPSIDVMIEGHCTCEAGNSQSCNHLVGLAYYLQHLILNGLKQVPGTASCTSIPMEWNKPRGTKILPEQIPNSVFIDSTNIERKKAPVVCRIKSPIRNSKLEKITQSSVARLKTTLNSINPSIPFASTLCTQSIPVPASSLLGHMARVKRNAVSAIGLAEEHVEEVEGLPLALPLDTKEMVDILISVAPVHHASLDTLTMEQAAKIEKDTRQQNRNDLWKTLRKFRFTASKFGYVCKRKLFNSEFIKQFVCPPDISHIKAVAHGVKSEKLAINAFLKVHTLTTNVV
ncbi:unnamed protein product [Ceutorhynchus assimilis]|uniref:SWIM-type domain-containing protein n=1 Tax=Ceutorhynchus assimilis TaxID=467358 RepID=A0A9N9N375_9CUCU|nr:unnamed protein product [Ceutorhynchus assimilis]